MPIKKIRKTSKKTIPMQPMVVYASEPVRVPTRSSSKKVGLPQPSDINQDAELFETQNIFLAAALFAYGIPLLSTKSNSGIFPYRGSFAFTRGVELDEAVQKYYQNNLLVDANKLYSSWKNLKALVSPR